MLDIAAWVLTYLIHSTLLIGGVALCAPLLRRRPDILSPLWKAALVGGLVTATVQLLAGVGPSLGALTAETETPPPRVQAQIPVANLPRAITAETEAVPASTMPFGGAGAAEVLPPDPLPAIVAEPLPASAVVSVATVDEPTPWWPYALAGLLALGLIAATVSLASGLASLRRVLRRREAVRDGPLPLLLRRLLSRARSDREVALSVAPELTVPMATGVLRAEIVVPRRVAEHLPVAHQETLLAHELAHVLRRDPAWRVLGLLIERLFFFQPLNRLATRGIAQTAEYLCDDWAARSTDRPLDLARCLTEVAGWATAGDAGLAPAAVGGAGPRSVLGRRVQRLLQTRRGASNRARHVALLAATLGLVGFVWLAPGVAISDAAEPPVPAVPPVPGVSITDHGITVVGTDDDGNPVQVVVADDQVSIVSSSPPEAEAPPAVKPQTRKEKRQAKKDAAKARRKAEKDVRKAFRQAKKNGEPAPDPDQINAIIRRAHGTKAEAPRSGSSYELRIMVPKDGEPAILLRRDGKVEHIDVEREVQRALRQAARARERAMRSTDEEVDRAIEQALRGYGPDKAEAVRRQVERHRKHAEKIEKQVHKEMEKAAREREKQMRELERMLRKGDLEPRERVIIRQRHREMSRGTFPIATPPAVAPVAPVAPVPPAAVAPVAPPRRVRAPRPPGPPSWAPASPRARKPRAPHPPAPPAAPDVVSI